MVCNMTKNVFMFIVITALLFFSISSVYSSDVADDSLDISEDATINQPIEQNTVQNEVKITNDKNIDINKNLKQDASEVSVTSYSQMITEINNAKTASSPVVISLAPGDYNATAQITWGGSSNKNLTINGNGLILDGNNKYKFALVQMNNYLTLNNITLQNYRSSGPGGTIQCMSQINIADSTFINNTATSSIGGVLNVQDFTGKKSTIDNCTFINNKALSGSAGAVNVNMATLTINNSRFINNSVAGSSSYGGAIYNMGTLTISNSIFDGNTNNNIGGAIATDNNLNVTNTTFTNNYAKRIGGAIFYGNNKLNLTNCTFENNTAETGGALSANIGVLNLTDSKFINNSAVTGGVIYTKGITNINTTVFDSNNATKAAVLYAETSNITLNNNTFKSNTASDETLYIVGTTPDMSDNTYEDTKISYEEFSLSTDKDDISSEEEATLSYPLTLTNPSFYQDLLEKSINQIFVNDINTINTTQSTSPFTQDTSGTYTIYVYNPALDIKTNEVVIKVTTPPKLVINPIEASIGDTVNITAQIEQDGVVLTDVSAGKIVFKVNGKTLKDATGKVIYAKVTNGVATINYTVTEIWNNNDTAIQATYSGSSKCDKLTSDETSITLKHESPKITTENIETTVGSKITLKATITDGSNIINSGKVVFKINGKTVKDANGKVIYAKVVNNEVTLEYTLPESQKAGTFNLTAVFLSNDYEKLEDNKQIIIA